MKLFTEISIEEPDFEINYQHKLFFIGSCFSDEISTKASYYGYELIANPFGTVYNSTAILNQIQFVVDDSFDLMPFIIKHNEEWVSLLHNTEFRNKDREKLLSQIATQREIAKAFLNQVSYLFITLGTSYVYKHLATGRIVSNNQKLPASDFEQVVLTTEQVSTDLFLIIELLKKVNPSIQLIFTVSPVRHLRLGMVNNQRSKASLQLAVQELLNQSDSYYFPSYEIALDELRDYRYFANDLVHLNRLGIDYIWERFEQTLMSLNEKMIRVEVAKLRKLQKHKVVNQENLNSHQQIIQKKQNELESKYGLKINNNEQAV